MSKKKEGNQLDNEINNLDLDKGIMEEMLRHARIGIYLFRLEDARDNSALRLIFANQASEKITGLVNEHILGKKIDCSFPQWREKGITSVLADVIETKEGVEIEDIYYKNEDVVTGAFLIKAYPVQNDCVCVTVENISRRIIEKHKLEQKSELLDLAVHEGNLAWWELNIQTRNMKGNKRVAELIGFIPGERGTTFDRWIERIHPDDRSKTMKIIEAHLEGKNDRYDIEYRIKIKDGSYRWLNDTGRVVKYTDDGSPLSLLVFSRDINRKKELEQETISQKKRFQNLVETTSDFIWEMDKSAVFTYVSPQIEQILGYKPEELLGKSGYKPMQSEEKDKISEIFNACVAGKKPFYSLINVNYHKKGHKVILESSGIPFFDEKGELLGFRGIDRDVTDTKKQEEQRQNSLEEKEVLLREIHHRVKNNLQIIISLIKLQGAYIADQDTLEHLREVSNRIRSMGIIHEKLYQTKNLSKINFADYIRTITHSLMLNFKIGEEKIETDFDLEKICLPIDTAIPCGLIINEVVSNILKHAFPGDMKGTIYAKLTGPDENEDYCLILGDNGRGLPDNVDFTGSHKLGLELINGLTMQLKGKVEIDRTNGTYYTILFKNVYKKK